MGLAEFLTARLAEDEAAARRDLDSTLPLRFVDADADSEPLIGLFAAERVLREVEAKRAILAELANAEANERPAYDRHLDGYFSGRADAFRWAVSDLVRIYSDHEDYNPEWK